MTPLDREARASGGAARGQKLGDWERAFVAMLGGSKRPITKDRRPSAEQVANELRQEGVEVPIPWNVYVAVGMNGSVVPSNLGKSEQVQAIQQMKEIAGFVGLIMFNRSWRTYTRKLLLHPLAQQRLDVVSKFFIDHVENFQTEEIKRRGKDAETALLSAQVYVDSEQKTFSMYYSFDLDRLPDPSSQRIGVVYLVNATAASGRYQVPAGTSSWVIRFHFAVPESTQFAAIMKEAKKHFAEVVKKLNDIQVSDIPKHS